MSIEYICSLPESLRTGENTGDGEIFGLEIVKALKLNLRAIDRLELGQVVETAETLCFMEIWITELSAVENWRICERVEVYAHLPSGSEDGRLIYNASACVCVR